MWLPFRDCWDHLAKQVIIRPKFEQAKAEKEVAEKQKESLTQQVNFFKAMIRLAMCEYIYKLEKPFRARQWHLQSIKPNKQKKKSNKGEIVAGQLKINEFDKRKNGK